MTGKYLTILLENVRQNRMIDKFGTVMVSELGKVILFCFDLAIHPWPPRSPDLTVCDFFLWGYVKEKVYAPPLLTNLEELKIKIKDAFNAMTPDMMNLITV
ncbi:hypothetical protein QTP88_011863 [Uroleucon formosanum]